jgi:hypothetical protein
MLARSGGDIGELRRHYALKRHIAIENAEVAGERVHAGDKVSADPRIVIGQVATDQFGDQLGLRGREQLASDPVARPTSALSAAWVLTMARTAAAAVSGERAISRSVVATDAIV